MWPPHGRHIRKLILRTVIFGHAQFDKPAFWVLRLSCMFLKPKDRITDMFVALLRYLLAGQALNNASKRKKTILPH